MISKYILLIYILLATKNIYALTLAVPQFEEVVVNVDTIVLGKFIGSNNNKFKIEKKIKTAYDIPNEIYIISPYPIMNFDFKAMQRKIGDETTIVLGNWNYEGNALLVKYGGASFRPHGNPSLELDSYFPANTVETYLNIIENIIAKFNIKNLITDRSVYTNKTLSEEKKTLVKQESILQGNSLQPAINNSIFQPNHIEKNIEPLPFLTLPATDSPAIPNLCWFLIILPAVMAGIVLYRLYKK